MTKEHLEKFIGTKSMTIVDAMSKIDINAKGILFIKDEQEKLCGCITDGDIRRWIIRVGKLNVSVSDVMNISPKYLFIDEINKAEAVIHNESITAIPIIDKKQQIVDIVLTMDKSNYKRNKPKMDLSKVSVIVMAGGKGTRLYPYTKILPKPLIPIGDTPIIERIINSFVDYGISNYYITVNYKKGMIKSYFNELKPSYIINYVEETKPLGTGGSIKLIKRKFDGPLFVTNCDTIVSTDYGDVYNYHITSGNSITIVSALKNITVPYGVIYAGDNGEVHNIEEKPRLSYFINTGMYIINPDTINLIPDNTMFHMTHLVEKVMKQGGKVGMYPVSEESFLDMGEFSEMKRMEEKLHIVYE